MRDINIPHPTIQMTGEEACLTCKFASAMGFCTKFNAEVAAFDGCESHEKRSNRIAAE